MPQPKAKGDLLSGTRPPFDLEEAALSIDHRLTGSTLEMFAPIKTGFDDLDIQLGGGLHGGDLILLGGVQNIGKTAVALQFAGNIAEDPSTLCIFVCYEHSVQAMLERLVIQHSFERSDLPFTKAIDLNAAYLAVIEERDRIAPQLRGMEAEKYTFWNRVIGRIPNGTKAWAKLSGKISRIWLNTGHSLFSTPDALEAYVRMAVDQYKYKRVVLFVDYVQRVPFIVPGARGQLTADERIDSVLRYLKSMALNFNNDGIVLAVVGVAAADKEGLRQGRVHVENLFGPETAQYEPDIALIMNKDLTKIDGSPVIRMCVEKNRHGPSDVEWRHKHYGAAFLFDRHGDVVPEEESWQAERRMLRNEQEERFKMKLLMDAMQRGDLAQNAFGANPGDVLLAEGRQG